MKSRGFYVLFGLLAVLLGELLTGELRTSVQSAALAGELPTLALTSPISGFTQPVTIGHAGDGSGRLFVVEQTGRIRIVRNGSLVTTPFLDISNRISTGSERGLLGLAFPPGFATKQLFYVNYTNPSGHITIARYRVSAGNPDVADAASEQIVLTINHSQFANHNGGQLAFSPRDGFLYIGTGDGGSGGDPDNRAQNGNDLLGKILRIDVETGNPITFTVPASNPFVGRVGFRPEIWALGLRNPWRFSFDRQAHDLYIGDVGQNAFEEVNFQPAASAGGENYGWRLMEGFHCFNPPNCNMTGLTLPVVEYDHSLGCSVTAGYVYRAATFPRMQGLFFYGDFCSGRIWGLRQENNVWQATLLLDTAINISTFGEDQQGNLFVADYNGGRILSVVDSAPAPTPTPTPTPTPASTTVQFSSSEFQVTENCTEISITVTRTGPLSAAQTVEYVTADNSAKQKTDFTYAEGSITFASGETTKNLLLLVSEDAYAEGTENFVVSLRNPANGLALGNPNSAAVVINDDELVDGTANPIDDNATFVAQHYHDFLNREPGEGLGFWVGELNLCGADAACLDDRRENVSTAFFLSIEFQATGYLVYRLERASFARLPLYTAFLRDSHRVSDGVSVGSAGWEQRVAANRQAFLAEWVNRTEFRALYDSKTNAQFVDTLFANSQVTPASTERDALVTALANGSKTRPEVLLEIVENGAVYNRQYNSAFVLLQYFGYLRRNPNDAPDGDLAGFNFWLNKLNQFSLPGEDMRDGTVAHGRVKRAEMVKAFIRSIEYRERFGR
ncbi:MAG TPA: PQQ-dependent sugar dehydrogenase [Pyrinomonadaceae bacterium]|nr:PQQ-dependent sugar dehydrogenase [Pyrinomonadaceae bacterium]